MMQPGRGIAKRILDRRLSLDRWKDPDRQGLNALALCRLIEARFGIRVHPVAVEMPPEIHGAAVYLQGDLVIYFRRDTDPFFQEKVILHELAHWCLGHLAAGREYRFGGYDSVEELEAEEWADRLLLWAMGLERRKGPAWDHFPWPQA